MEEPYAFMQRIREVPLRESGEPVRHLPATTAAGSVRMRFSDRPHVGGLPRQFFLRGVAPLLAAGGELNDRACSSTSTRQLTPRAPRRCS